MTPHTSLCLRMPPHYNTFTFTDADNFVDASVAALEECASSPPRQMRPESKTEPEPEPEPEDGNTSDKTDPGIESDKTDPGIDSDDDDWESEVVDSSQPAQTFLLDSQNVANEEEAVSNEEKEVADEEEEEVIVKQEAVADEGEEGVVDEEVEVLYEEEEVTNEEEDIADEEEEEVIVKQEVIADEEEEGVVDEEEEVADEEEVVADEKECKSSKQTAMQYLEEVCDRKEVGKKEKLNNEVNANEIIEEDEEQTVNPIEESPTVIPETQFQQPQESENSSALAGLTKEMIARDLDPQFSQIEIDFDAVKEFEKNHQIVEKGSKLDQLRQNVTLSQGLDIINAPDEDEESREGERPVTPGGDLPESLTAYVATLREEDGILEGVTQGVLVRKEPSELQLMPPTGPSNPKPLKAEKMVSSKPKPLSQNPNTDDAIASTSASAFESASASASTSTSASISASGSSSKPLKTSSSNKKVEKEPESAIGEKKKREMPISPLAKAVKEIKTANDAGFPSTKKQCIVPEKRPKKVIVSEASAEKKLKLDAEGNIQSGGSSSSSMMHLKDSNGRWAAAKISSNMASLHASLPPLDGGKASTTTTRLTTQLPPSKTLKDPLSGRKKENRVIHNPPLPTLTDPITGRKKENKVIHVPPLPTNQSLITPHTVHQFKQKESGNLQLKVPEVKKKSKKNVGKFQNKLPSKLRHRACCFCFKVFPSKASKNPNGFSPHLHIITSQCPFIRANCLNVVNKGVCYACFEKFQPHKLINEDIVNHFEMTDHDVICHLCRKIVPFSRIYDHLLDEMFQYFKSGVACTRCDKNFNCCESWVQHIKTDHVSSPNLAHFNRFLPLVQEDMKIREAKLFCALHFNASS